MRHDYTVNGDPALYSKICGKCNEEKPLTMFHRRSKAKDGRKGLCKQCNINYTKDHRLRNIDRIREYDRDRGNRQTAEYHQKWRNANPNKYKAHKLVNVAVRTGRMPRPKACEGCSEETILHAHHDDYSLPYDVRWLCPACHKQWHIANGEGANPR